MFGREVSSFPFCGRIPKEGKCIVSCIGCFVVEAFVFFRKAGEFEEEEVEPLTEIVAKINQTNATIESQTASLLDMLGQLHGTTPEADEELKAFVEAFKG